MLYSADSEPVVALLGLDALVRDVGPGSSGEDVRALEENLVSLGFGSSLKVDHQFDQATGAAVNEWERELGRRNPDGVVSVGEAVFLREPAAVTGHRAAVGDRLNLGTAVLSLATESHVVSALIDVADRGDWGLGTLVQLQWGEEAETGTVIEVGRAEIGGQLEITITPTVAAPSLPVGTEVEVVVTTAESEGAVTVPVSALTDGPAGPSVRRVTPAGDRLTPVEVGIVASGLAEIAEGLAAGTKVRLPG